MEQRCSAQNMTHFYPNRLCRGILPNTPISRCVYCGIDVPIGLYSQEAITPANFQTFPTKIQDVQLLIQAIARSGFEFNHDCTIPGVGQTSTQVDIAIILGNQCSLGFRCSSAGVVLIADIEIVNQKTIQVVMRLISQYYLSSPATSNQP
jgi:hypothetical protein